jgi:hypothetical protein
MFGQAAHVFYVQYLHVRLQHILPAHALVLNVQRITFETELEDVVYVLLISQIVWNVHHKMCVHSVMQQINFM